MPYQRHAVSQGVEERGFGGAMLNIPSHRLGFVLLALLGLLAAACGGNGATSSGSGSPGGSNGVDLEVPDMAISAYQGQAELGGEEVRLSGVLGQGKPVVVNFWAALCPPCRAEMPDFQRVYRDRSNEVTILGVDVGPQVRLGSREQGQDLLRDLNITYPAGTTFDENIARAYSISSMPTTLFIHSDGRVMRTWRGPLTEAKMNELIDQLVQG
jgi:thiol-disulfide isomerase/thioredoxin